MRIRSSFALVGAATLLGACATTPTGPGSNRHARQAARRFEAFQQDAADCQQYAQASLGGPNAGQAVNDRAAGTAVAGSALGAATGAIIGSATNQGGQGAAIGAGVGLAVRRDLRGQRVERLVVADCSGSTTARTCNACMRTATRCRCG